MFTLEITTYRSSAIHSSAHFFLMRAIVSGSASLGVTASTALSIISCSFARASSMLALQGACRERAKVLSYFKFVFEEKGVCRTVAALSMISCSFARASSMYAVTHCSDYVM